MALQTASTPAPAHDASATGLRFDLRSPTVSLAAAGLAAGGVLAAGTGGPQLTSLAAAAFLFLATHWDVGHRRVPNWLTFPAMTLALAAHAAAAGLEGAGLALAFGELLRRWATALGASLATRRFVYLPPPADAPAARALPFAPVLAAGAAAAFAWGTPWA
jgi:prepilin signal peptidase PulO-like enzyme (type II secretory pathway)